MNREEIYDHLAQVYLGKRKQIDKKKKQQFNAWLVINIFITFIIFASVSYGLTAFLTQRSSDLKTHIVFALHQGSLQVDYDFVGDLTPLKVLTLDVPTMDITKYKSLKFSMRGRSDGGPGIVKVLVKNDKNEVSAYYIQGVGVQWREYSVSLEEFNHITDWVHLKEISFVLESWNVENKKGVVLIDEVRFSSI